MVDDIVSSAENIIKRISHDLYLVSNSFTYHTNTYMQSFELIVEGGVISIVLSILALIFLKIQCTISCIVIFALVMEIALMGGFGYLSWTEYQKVKKILYESGKKSKNRDTTKFAPVWQTKLLALTGEYTYSK